MSHGSFSLTVAGSRWEDSIFFSLTVAGMMGRFMVVFLDSGRDDGKNHGCFP